MAFGLYLPEASLQLSLLHTLSDALGISAFKRHVIHVLEVGAVLLHFELRLQEVCLSDPVQRFKHFIRA